MIKTMKKNWLLWLILGIIIFGLGLFLIIKYFISDPHTIVINFGDKSKLDLMLLVSGLLVAILAVFIIFPSFKASRGGYKIIYGLELLIVAFVAVFGFIIPFFLDIFGVSIEAFNFLAVNQWYGLIFWIHGAIKLSQCAFSSPKNKGLVFLVGLLAVSFGVWLFFNGPKVEQFQIIVAFAIAILGAIMLGIAIVGATERKRVKN
ncbi:hypothetical protein LJC17_03490 [Acholeplasma sp. OttesenSCG-928-E16]|nr:hypothetical protein [Acholeplasma sp. OttesenSCG-928-E16]